MVTIIGSLIYLGWLIYFAITNLTIKDLIPQLTVIVPAVAAVITVGCTIYAAIRTKSVERLKEIEQELRKQTAPNI